LSRVGYNLAGKVLMKRIDIFYKLKNKKKTKSRLLFVLVFNKFLSLFL